MERIRISLEGGVYKSRATSKGQLTLPKGLREAYRVHEGETVVLVPVKGGLLLKHDEDVRLSDLWRGLRTPEEAENLVEELRSQWRTKRSTSPIMTSYFQQFFLILAHLWRSIRLSFQILIQIHVRSIPNFLLF